MKWWNDEISQPCKWWNDEMMKNMKWLVNDEIENDEFKIWEDKFLSLHYVSLFHN